MAAVVATIVGITAVTGCRASTGSGAPAAASGEGEGAQNHWSTPTPPTCDSVQGAAAVAGIEIAQMHDVTDTLAEGSIGHYTLVCNGTLADRPGTLVVQLGPMTRAGFDRQIRGLTDGPSPTRRLTSDALGADAYLTRAPKQPMVSIDAWRQGEQLTVALPRENGTESDGSGSDGSNMAGSDGSESDGSDEHRSDPAIAQLEAFAEEFGPRLGWDTTAD